MNRWVTLPVLLGLTLGASYSRAHHSSAMYDREAPVTIHGVVVRREWKNPHVYLYLRQDGGDQVVWTIEGWPPFVLQRMGWTKDSVQVGDRVTVTGIAARDPKRKGALMETLAKPGEAALEVKAAQLIAALSQPPGMAPGKASSIAGKWVPLLDANSMRLMLSSAGLALTSKGKAAADAYSDAEQIRCVAAPAPLFMITPDVKSIEVSRNTVVIRGDSNAMSARTVHLNLDSHRGATPSAVGHAIGRWEGRTLVIDTAQFAPHGAGGTVAGVPSGTGKHLVERLQLREDGSALSYSFRLEDPEYLAAPLEGTAQWGYRPDAKYQVAGCDIRNARRFLE